MIESAIAFLAGIFFGKVAELISERVLYRFGRPKFIQDIYIFFTMDKSSFHYSEQFVEGWIDVPIQLKANIYNGSRSRRTFSKWKIRFFINPEGRDNFPPGSYLTTLFDQVIAIDPETHQEIFLRGWASFFLQDIKDQERCEVELRSISASILSVIWKAHLYATDVCYGREYILTEGFGADVLIVGEELF